MQNELVFFISENDCNMRLDRWLVKKFNTTFIQIVKLIRQKKCKVNNMSTTINYKLNFGDKITIKKINLIEKDNQKSSINLNVLKKIQVVYKDENLLFINKPTNLAVQPGTGINSALSDMLAEFSFDMDNKPYLVHRIDKETSGLMVLARNRPTSVILGDIFKNNLIKKYYLAITHKSNIPLEGIINQPLYYDGISKSATTKYNVLAVNDHFMLIKCQILTGRKHQIRLHF